MTLNQKIKKFKSRPMSWSSISQFNYDRGVWYEKYIEGKKGEKTSPLVFGKRIGEQLASDNNFLPKVPRLKEYEHKLSCKIGNIEMVGYLDNFDLDAKCFSEFKTGKKWDKRKAENHGQITLYAAMIYLIYNIHPKDLKISLIWLPTEEQGDFSMGFVQNQDPVIFPIKKSMRDILMMLAEVKDTYEKMLLYIKERG